MNTPDNIILKHSNEDEDEAWFRALKIYQGWAKGGLDYAIRRYCTTMQEELEAKQWEKTKSHYILAPNILSIEREITDKVLYLIKKEDEESEKAKENEKS